MKTTNLPLPLNSLVGRRDEIADCKRLLATKRLLTVTGVGGGGKTRVALAVAEQLMGEYADGTWLIEFASLEDPAQIPQALAHVLAVEAKTHQPLVDVLIEHLRECCMLLVFDTCEHLILDLACLAEALLRACPYLQILCTSREPLGVPGEAVYFLPVLSTPDLRDVPISPAGLMDFEAVQLLVDRVAEGRPSFLLNERNAGAVAELCCQLEGVPLAIELAATRLRTLAVGELATRLREGFHLLDNGTRSAPARQQTLQAAFDWSYGLLTLPERSLFTRLAVFSGGWTLTAAEAVCQEPGSLVLDLLPRLIDKSLVVVNLEDGGSGRYRLLEPVRQYAWERLAASDVLGHTRERHLRFFLRWAEAASEQQHGPEQSRWLQNLGADDDNVSAAFHWAMERDEASGSNDLRSAALRLANALPWLCHIDGHVSDRRHIQAVREAPGSKRFAVAWQTGDATTIQEAGPYATTHTDAAYQILERPRTARQKTRDEYGGLTSREREVASLISEGKSNREIAEMLVVSERTAAVHVGNILSKLALSSRTQVAAWAIARGIGISPRAEARWPANSQ